MRVSSLSATTHVGIPLPARPLRLFSHSRLGEADTDADNLIVGARSPWRFPVPARKKEIHA